MIWNNYIVTFIGLYLIIAVRYFAVAGLFYWMLWKRDPKKVTARKLTPIRPDIKVIRNEIRWSLVASAIYAIPGTIILEAWKGGGTAMYSDVGEFGWPYVFLSVFLYLFLQDTYFYWTHRMMHRPKLFRIFHKVHHESRQPTPWAAFSFHPYESIVGALAIPVLIFIIPIHIGAVLFILVLMTVCSVINHAGYEVFPDAWLRGFWGRYFISAAHHNLHHQRYHCNFALYFRFWDKVMGTDVLETAYDFLNPHPVTAKPKMAKASDYRD